MGKTIKDFDAELGDEDDDDTEIASRAGERLRGFIEEIERIEGDMHTLKEERSDVYAEAKAAGFEPKIMRTIIRLRAMSREAMEEEQELLDLYKKAIGL